MTQEVITMTRCPYCGKIANPIKFVVYSRRHLYCCPGCGRRSRLNLSALIMIGLVASVIGEVCLSMIGLLVTLPVVGGFILASIWLLLKLHPVSNGVTSEWR